MYDPNTGRIVLVGTLTYEPHPMPPEQAAEMRKQLPAFRDRPMLSWCPCGLQRVKKAPPEEWIAAARKGERHATQGEDQIRESQSDGSRG